MEANVSLVEQALARKPRQGASGLCALEYSASPAAPANDLAAAREPLELVLEQREKDLPHAVGAEVRYQDPVAAAPAGCGKHRFHAVRYSQLFRMKRQACIASIR